jgi:glycyl-tRNA synthetase beta chain
LGVIRMLIERQLPLELRAVLGQAFAAFGAPKAGEVALADPTDTLEAFLYDRLAGSLREQGASAQEVDAVLAPQPQRLGEVPKLLAAVRAFAALPEAPALAAANKRIGNILKKSPEADAHVSELLLQEPAEKALHAAMQEVVPVANVQFEAGDYTASLRTLAALRDPVDDFFDDVMVNAEQSDLRLNRLGLLMLLHASMNRVAQLERLAT